MEDVWEDRTILIEVVGGSETYSALVVKLNGLGKKMVYMDRRWREFAVPCHNHRHELQPGGQAEAIVVDFGDVETG